MDSKERSLDWLNRTLNVLVEAHFPEISERHDIIIVYGRKARTRLGSITKKDDKRSIIRVNGLFRNSSIPEYVVKATIFHELCHYVHGYHSNFARKHRYPHANGVIKTEFEERGQLKLFVAQKKWLKEHWREFIQKELGPARRRARRVARYRILWL